MVLHLLHLPLLWGALLWYVVGLLDELHVWVARFRQVVRTCRLLAGLVDVLGRFFPGPSCIVGSRSGLAVRRTIGIVHVFCCVVGCVSTCLRGMLDILVLLLVVFVGGPCLLWKCLLLGMLPSRGSCFAGWGVVC